MNRAHERNSSHLHGLWSWRGAAVLVVALCVGMLLALVGVLRAPYTEAATRLEEAEERWKAVRPRHYLLEVRMITLHGGEALRLEVRDEQVVAGWSGNGVAPVAAQKLRDLHGLLPMDSLFGLVHSEIEQRMGWRERLARAFPPLERWLLDCPLRALPQPTYDAEYGYPRRLFVGFAACQPQNDGVELRVEGLQVLP